VTETKPKQRCPPGVRNHGNIKVHPHENTVAAEGAPRRRDHKMFASCLPRVLFSGFRPSLAARASPGRRLLAVTFWRRNVDP